MTRELLAYLAGVMLLSATGLGAGPASAAASDWPGWGYDATNTRNNSAEKTLGPGNVGYLGQHWEFIGNNLNQGASEPAISNGVVYLGSSDGRICALDADTGTLIWSFTAGDVRNSSPAVVNGVVYVGSNDGNVYALDAATGAVAWTRAVGSPVDTSPTVASGTVYIGSEDANTLYALDATTGALNWTYAAPSPMSAPASAANALVYVVEHAQVVALSASTGTVVWGQTVLAGIVGSAPAVVDGVVYAYSMAGSANGVLYAFAAATGDLLWKYPSAWFAGSLAVSSDTVYGYFNGSLNAIDSLTGLLIWAVPAAWDLYTAPSVANGVVYYVNDRSLIAGADASTGAALWTTPPANAIYTGLTVADGQVLAGVAGNGVFAFGLIGPTVTSVTPSTGPAAGGTKVTITGTGFAGATGVLFGDVPARSYTVMSDTQIAAVSPAQASGTYDVRITTPGGTSPTGPADGYVVQRPPPTAAYAPSTITPTVGQAVSFDATASTAPAPATITGYRWVWGDGTADASGVKATHAFATAGARTVWLYVTDSDGKTGAVGHAVSVGDELPVAAFTATSYAPPAGHPVTFSGAASSDPDGSVTAYRWVWGDGSPDGTGVTATHAFAAPGPRTVRLYVTDSDGKTGVVGHAVSVGDELPVAAFTATSYAPVAGQTVTFSGAGSSDPDGSVTAYRWVWGDGSPDGTGVTPTHGFATSGARIVRLYVTDSDGRMGVVGHVISVKP